MVTKRRIPSKTKTAVLNLLVISLCVSSVISDKAPQGPSSASISTSGGYSSYKAQPLNSIKRDKEPSASSFGGGGHSANGQEQIGVSGGGGGYAQASQDLYSGHGHNSNHQPKELSGGGYNTVQSSQSFGPSGGYNLSPGTPDLTYGPPSSIASSSNSGPLIQGPSQGISINNPGNQITTQPDGQSYTYYYQHYPTSYRPQGQGQVQGHGQGQGHGFQIQGQGQGQGWSGEEGGGGFLDGFGGEGAGIAGLGGLGGLAGIAAIAKGILAIKPFLIIGLLFLISIPLLLIFLPIPILTINDLNPPTTPAPTGDGPAKVRGYGYGGPPSIVGRYISQFSERILNADECLERIICKLPQVPGGSDYQSKAKFLWEKYGKKYFKNSHRVQRGMEAYFNTSPGSMGGRGVSKAAKCNQKFKCSNNLF